MQTKRRRLCAVLCLVTATGIVAREHFVRGDVKPLTSDVATRANQASSTIATPVIEIITRRFPAVPAGASTYVALCPPGKRVLSGGHSFAHLGSEVAQSYPFADTHSEGWAIAAAAMPGIVNSLTIFAVCAILNSSGVSPRVPVPTPLR